MYLRRLILENFQSHKHTDIHFSKGTNVIVGPNNSGKTAILRALRFVVYNEPDGRYFIRHGSSHCKVTTEWSNGYSIVREKGKSTYTPSSYTIIDKEGKEEVFTSFGKGVPKEVAEALGFEKLLIGDSEYELNYGSPLESPFLLTSTSSERASFIGQLAESARIDRVVDLVSSEIRKGKQDLSTLASQVKDKELILQADNTVELKRQYRKVRAKIVFIEREEASLENIKSFSRDLEKVESSLSICSNRLKQLKGIVKIDLSKNVLEKRRQHSLYTRFLGQLFEIDFLLRKASLALTKLPSIGKVAKDINLYNIFCRLQEKLKEYSVEHVQITLPDVKDLEGNVQKYIKLSKLKKEWFSIETDLQTQVVKSCQLKRDSQKYQKELRELLTQTKVCPICFQELKNVDIILNRHSHQS